jgi:hypothetical protein
MNVHHIFFICSSAVGHLGCFQSLADVNSAAINMGQMLLSCPQLPFPTLYKGRWVSGRWENAGGCSPCGRGKAALRMDSQFLEAELGPEEQAPCSYLDKAHFLLWSLQGELGEDCRVEHLFFWPHY